MVDLAFELVQTGDIGHLDVATRAHGSNQAFKAAVGRVIDDPTGVFVLVRLGNLEVESGLFLEAVPLPELGDLIYDLLPVWISALPFDRRMESVHDGMDLETRCVVYPLRSVSKGSHFAITSDAYTPDSTQLFLGTSVENGHVETMANAVCGGTNARDAGADDGNLWS